MMRFAEKHWKDLDIEVLCAFTELSVSDDPWVRKRSIAYGKRAALRLQRHYLQSNQVTDASSLMDAVELVGYTDVLRFNTKPLQAVIERMLPRYATAEKLLGVPLAQLDKLTDRQLYGLLINTYLLERASAALSKNYRTSFTLFHTLRYLRKRPYLSFRDDPDPDKDKSEDDAYLATHVAFALNNFGQIKLSQAHLPQVYPYLRNNFWAVLERKDIELVAEFVDVFRAMGFDERTDKMVARGTDFLLRTQRKDGSWGPWEKEENAYDAFHYTWCAVLGLRGHNHRKGTAFAQRRHVILQQLNPTSPKASNPASPKASNPTSQPDSPASSRATQSPTRTTTSRPTTQPSRSTRPSRFTRPSAAGSEATR